MSGTSSWEGWGEPLGVMVMARKGVSEEARRRVRQRIDEEIAAWHTLLGDAPKFALPHRNMHLLQGPLDALSDFYERHRNPPSLWWPDDRAWCVATDIDLMTTYIGASRQAVEVLLADEQIEALAVPVDQSVTWEADTINPLPQPPY